MPVTSDGQHRTCSSSCCNKTNIHPIQCSAKVFPPLWKDLFCYEATHDTPRHASLDFKLFPMPTVAKQKRDFPKSVPKAHPTDKGTESGTFRPLQFIGIQTLHCIPCHLFSVRCIEPRYNDSPLTSPAPIPSPHLKSSSNKPGKGGKIQIHTTAPPGLRQAKIEREVRNFHPIFYLYTRNCSRSHALQQRQTRERFPHQTARYKQIYRQKGTQKEAHQHPSLR